VTSVLNTIDVEAARSSPRHWEKVCEYFAGCARAARAQGATPRDGGRRIAAHLNNRFPCGTAGSNEGFFEFMDWLSEPARFQPAALRSSLEQI